MHIYRFVLICKDDKAVLVGEQKPWKVMKYFNKCSLLDVLSLYKTNMTSKRLIFYGLAKKYFTQKQYT